MPSVVADSAKVRSILYLNVNEFFCQLRATLCMRARVYMCESVGVGLWCRVCCCVCLRVCVGLEYKMQSAAQFQQVEDIFIMTNISYSFFLRLMLRCVVALLMLLLLRLFVCVYKNVGFAHFLFYFVFCKRKKTSGRILI